ncbi:hypothetical protein GH714_042108 [Hevea brasiliensis]|uniref:Uncharacterized protein n=1 Tax=Hevea brasiliensis TaxID=3981 RepID=A0A6A6MUL6_HEVBR|nr:hypothetical protein GH714_042108 [Hevea brasiliensis]
MRVKMRLPKAEVEKLMQESKDDAEAAAKIMELCIANKGGKRSTEIAPQQQVHLQWPWQSRKRKCQGTETSELPSSQ